MKGFRKGLAIITLGAVGTAGWMAASNLIQNVQYTRAAEQVEATRQQLQSVNDTSTVFRDVGKTVEPSVVNIEVRKTVHAPQTSTRRIPDDLLRHFFPD